MRLSLWPCNCLTLAAYSPRRQMLRGGAYDPEKWRPVFGNDHAQTD
jgi:hypothetical protein